MEDLKAIPIGARTIRMLLMGTRNAGTDNDSYFDDLFIKIQTTVDDCESLEVGLKKPTGLSPINVFPNPSNGKISIEASASMAGKAFFISNLSGETTFNGKLKEGVQTLDLSQSKAGVYFLNIPNGSPTKFVLN